ncbi:MAG: hypothetical protein ACYS0G_10075 [Planctomycetota bacterium]|jgi:hypothetical protein
MKMLTSPLRKWALLPICAAIIVVAAGAGRSQQLKISGGDVRGFVVPAVQIISFDDTVGMLDTASGAVYRLRGDLDNPSVRNTWEIRVPAVGGETSGYLEIQRPNFGRPDATFLVDIVTGRTWILRRRASTNRSWDPVEIYR